MILNDSTNLWMRLTYINGGRQSYERGYIKYDVLCVKSL